MTASSTLFEDSDVELLTLLTSNGDFQVKNDQNRISAYFDRFQQDAVTETAASGTKEYWNDRVNALSALGISMKDDLVDSLPVSSEQPSTALLPAAFETISGKKHILAVSKLLRISRLQAVTLTLSALRNINDTTHLQSILGTHTLLKTVVQHHFRERAARLQILAELLRMEQETDCPHYVVQYLDNIDMGYLINEKPRGLFRRLVVLTTAPASPPNREELTPLKDLHGSDDGFVTAMMDEVPTLRENAMEALLVLMYSRVKVSRLDVILLLQAFASYHCFFSDLPLQRRRLTLLCGLVCAECFSLWLTTSSNWVDNHPLLEGLMQGAAPVQNELEVIRSLLLQYCSNLVQRRVALLANISKASDIIIDAPEALAMLAFGLLLRLAYQSQPSPIVQSTSMYWHQFKDYAMECTTIASDEVGAFGYLDVTMRGLLSANIALSARVYHEESPFDWQWPQRTLLIERSPQADDVDATEVAYISIGLELLSSTMSAFTDSILTCAENIQMLANLAAVIYSNHAIMCVPFWKEFESYDSTAKVMSPNHHVASLLNAAYNLAATSMNQREENCLPSVAPLMRLLSSLCFDSDSTSMVLGMLPPGMIQKVIVLCAPTGYLVDEAGYAMSVLGSLESIHTMAKMDKAMSLQESMKGDGPRLTYLILSSSNNNAVKRVSLRLMSAFMSAHWAVSSSKLFQNDSLERYLANPNLTVAAVDVLNAFVRNMSTVVFTTSSDKEVRGYLNMVLRFILEACNVFATFPASTTSKRKSHRDDVSLCIVKALSGFIRSIRQIVIFHSSSQVRAVSSDCRDSLIQALATNTLMGCALAHAACSPVTMSLAIELADQLSEAKLLNLASDEFAVDEEANQFGAWRSMSRNPSAPNTVSRVRSSFHARLLNMQGLNFDMSAAYERGWVGNDVVHLAAAAIEVMGLWAMLVDDVLGERYDLNVALPQDAIAYIKDLSPMRLVSSAAIVPSPMRECSSLSMVWKSEILSVLDILSWYLVANDHMPTHLTLNFLTICLQHGNAAGDQSPALRRALNPKGQLRTAMSYALKRCCDLFSGEFIVLGNSEKNILTQGMRALHLLHSVIASLQSPLEFFSDGTILESLKQIVSSVAAFMRVPGGSLHTRLLDDDLMLAKLRVALKILTVFTLAHKLRRSPIGAEPCTHSTEILSGPFLGDLCSMSLAIISTPFACSGVALHITSVLNSFLSRCFDLLAAQAVIEMNNSEGGNNTGFATNLITENGGALIFGSTQDYLHFSGPVLTSKAFGTFVSRTHPILRCSQPLSMCAAFPTTLTSSIVSFGQRRCDVTEAVTWLTSLDPDHSADFVTYVSDIDSSVSLVDSELALVSSWSRIAHVYVLTSRVPTSETAFRVLQQFQHNCEVLDDAQEGASELTILSTIAISNAFSSVLLSLFQQFELMECTVDLLAMLTVTIEKLTNLSDPSVASSSLQATLLESICKSQVRLLTCCTSLIMALQRDDYYMNECEDALIRLIECTCMCVAHACDNPILSSLAQNFCMIAMSFLTNCISVGDGRQSFYAKAAEAMELHSTVNRLISRAASEAIEAADASSIAFVNATLIFIALIAEAGNSSPKMASLLFDYGLPNLLVFSPLIVGVSRQWSGGGQLRNERARYRGYIQTSTKVANTSEDEGMTLETDRLLLRGKDDPLHSLWVDTISVVRTLARTNMVAFTDSKKKTFFVNLALDFVKSHKSAFLSCLRQMHSSDVGTVLTYNLVREATEVLSLVAEMCKARNNDIFERSTPDILHEFKQMAKAVLVSVTKFLGSSGTARELFSLLAKIDSMASQDDQTNGIDQPQDIHPSFSSGIPSGRHEAIRNAHLARRCYALVTKSEYDSSSIGNSSQGTLGQFSASTLEQNCQRAVNSPFNLRMEHATALCLSHAISILWRTHPASSCFVLLTESESQLLSSTSMSLIKPGTIIAYRDNRQSDEMRYGRVMRSDTGRRAWTVTSLQSESIKSLDESNYEVVQATQLAGMEEQMKRTTVLRYSAAQENAAELDSKDSSRTPASVGNLIIALRWCCQHEETGSARDLIVRRSLAAGAAILLGTELSLHYELGTAKRSQANDDTKRLNEQLFQIFDDTSLDLDEELAQLSRKGRVKHLKTLLGSNTWDGFQQQVYRRLASAQVTIQKEQEQRKAALQSVNPWLHGARSFKM